MPDRRFRDMSLTVGDIEYRVAEHLWENYAPGYPTEEHAAKLEARAKSLLPLWRQWGLRDLRAQLAREPVAPHVMCEAEFPSWSKPEKGES